MNNVLPVTVVIPTLNEEKNLQHCLDCLNGFFKVYIVDSGSTDDTLNIAKKNNIEIINFNWNGQFPKKRNWFLQNYKLQTPWVFFLDADEYVTNDFKKELEKKLHSNVVGFEVFYSIIFLGKKLNYFKTQKLPLFRVGFGQYEKIEENNWSSFDMEIHEHPILNGKIAKINSCIEHYDDKGLTAYITKHNQYSSWEANRYLTLKANIEKEKLLFRQKIKYSLLNSCYFATLYFIYIFFFKFGFLDGKNGLIFSSLKKQYFSQIHFKIFELKNKKNDKENKEK